MALYKGNRDRPQGAPSPPPAGGAPPPPPPPPPRSFSRSSALRRSSPPAGGGHSTEIARAPAPEAPEAASEADDLFDFEDGEGQPSVEIPLPPGERQDPESSGKVFGRSRNSHSLPPQLSPYRETIVIGGDARPEPPPPPSLSPTGDPAPAVEATTATSFSPPAPAVDQEILAKAQMEAQQIIAQAQAQAQQMLQEAQAQIQAHAEQVAQQAGQQGYQDGLQQGIAAGQEQGIAESQQRLEQLKLEFVELVMARRKVLSSMEGEIVQLSVNIAEKILGLELATGRDVISGIVRQALATLKERDEVSIRVHPSEVEAITAHQKDYEAMIEGLKRFEVVADGAIEPGSCAIETSMGNVDARISTQLEAVRAGLDEMVKIRAFEMKDKLATEPVEVPGDPEFHARILQAEAEAAAAEAAAKAHH